MVSGCTSTDDVVNSVGGAGLPTPQEASGAATSNVTGKATNAIGAVGKSGASTAVTNSVLRMLGGTPVSGDDPTGPVEAQINNSFGLLFSGDPVVDGSKITFNPDENLLCADSLFLTLFDDAKVSHDFTTSVTCPLFYSHLTLDLGVSSLTEGTIDFKYGSDIFTSISYDDDPNDKFLINRINLANYKSIFTFMNAQGFFAVDPQFPDTFDGVVGVEVKDLGGGDHAQVRFFIEQDLNIFDAALGEELFIGASPNLLDITANANTGDFAFGTDLAAGNLGYNEEDTGNNYPVKVDWDTWSGNYQLDASDKNIINGFTTPINIRQNIEDSLSPNLDWELKLGQYDWKLNGSLNTITFNQPYDTTFKSNDVLNVFNNGEVGDLAVSKIQGTELQYVTEDLSGNPSLTNDFGQTRWRVKAGSVGLSGSGAYADLNDEFWGGTISPGDTDGSLGPLRDSFTFDQDNPNSNSFSIPIQRTYTF